MEKKTKWGVDYQGARETDAMYQALVDALVDYTTKIRHQEGLDKFLAKPVIIYCSLY